MKRFGGIPAVVLAIATVVAAVMNNLPIAAVCLIVLIGVVAVASMRQSATARASDPTEDLNPESRTLFLRIRRLNSDIEQMVERSRSTPAVQYLGKEALTESNRILAQVAQSLKVRQDLKKALSGASLISRDTEALERQISEARTADEREALEVALQAKKLEVGHYVEIERMLTQIDGGIKQAEAALGEMKARLAVSVTNDKAAEVPEEDIRETIGRMRAITLSVDEAEEILRG
jgi:hypothetical protein